MAQNNQSLTTNLSSNPNSKMMKLYNHLKHGIKEKNLYQRGYEGIQMGGIPMLVAAEDYVDKEEKLVLLNRDTLLFITQMNKTLFFIEDYNQKSRKWNERVNRYHESLINYGFQEEERKGVEDKDRVYQHYKELKSDDLRGLIDKYIYPGYCQIWDQFGCKVMSMGHFRFN